jgi:hypothetical protein
MSAGERLKLKAQFEVRTRLRVFEPVVEPVVGFQSRVLSAAGGSRTPAHQVAPTTVLSTKTRRDSTTEDNCAATTPPPDI